MTPAGVTAQTPPNADAAVRQAVANAVRARMGETAVVRIGQLRIDCAAGTDFSRIVATPEPGSRVGRLLRMALTLTPSPTEERPGDRQVGRAVGDVYVAVAHVRSTAAIEQGATLDESDLEASLDEIGVAPLAPLPVLRDLLGGRATRAIRPGEVLTTSSFRTMPLVKSGDIVRVSVRIGNVEAVGTAVAQQSGHRNDRIRLINPESRRAMTGRVIGPGEVEVIHES